MKSRNNILINLLNIAGTGPVSGPFQGILAIAVWMFENGKGAFAWIPLISGSFYAFVTVTYIVNAKIGFGMPWGVAYAVGAVAAVAYIVSIVMYGKKRAASVHKK